jgi:transposase
MFLRAKDRIKDGKKHRYWSIVENRRIQGNGTVQRQVLHLGEINDNQKAAWCKTIDIFQEDKTESKQIAIFPEDRQAPLLKCDVVHIKLNEIQLHNPRQRGACWLASLMWDQLNFDEFWKDKLLVSRKGTNWLNVFKTLVSYRLIAPGSEWRLHRQWYERSAMADLLGEDFGLVQVDKLYRCMDKLLLHKEEMFSFLKKRWETLFDVKFDVLLYDLTSTYFECDPPESGKRKFGYSRDKRSDCVQVVIALIVTTEGFPLAYEVMPGNTSDKTTLDDFLKKIENRYGKYDRIWLMDRGIPTEETLEKMKNSEYPIHYLVGTPRGRLSKLEKEFVKLPWEKARDSVETKLLEHEGEIYILTRSSGRVNKERSMRKRHLKKLWKRLHELQEQKLTRDQLLIKLGEAKKEAGRAYSLVAINLPGKDKEVTKETFTFTLDKERLSTIRRREGHYLLRSNLAGEKPVKLWEYYIQLIEIEQVFKELKNDLSIRPIYHQKDNRIESHIFIAFVAYCLQVTLKQRLRALAPGLTPIAVIEKFAEMQMVDVHLPTTDGREIILSRYTQPEKDQKILLHQMKLKLPDQPPPKITSGKNIIFK